MIRFLRNRRDRRREAKSNRSKATTDNVGGSDEDDSSDRMKLTTYLVDLADECKSTNEVKKELFRHKHSSGLPEDERGMPRESSQSMMNDPIDIIRQNLPQDPLLLTPFGSRRMTYCDYTASGRSLHFIEGKWRDQHTYWSSGLLTFPSQSTFDVSLSRCMRIRILRPQRRVSRQLISVRRRARSL